MRHPQHNVQRWIRRTYPNVVRFSDWRFLTDKGDNAGVPPYNRIVAGA
jgi:hypothetical protein